MMHINKFVSHSQQDAANLAAIISHQNISASCSVLVSSWTIMHRVCS